MTRKREYFFPPPYCSRIVYGAFMSIGGWVSCAWIVHMGSFVRIGVMRV